MNNNENKIQVPQEVQVLIDRASSDDCTSLAIMFANGSVRLVDTMGGGFKIVEEVAWDKAGEFGRNLQNNIMKSAEKHSGFEKLA